MNKGNSSQRPAHSGLKSLLLLLTLSLLLSSCNFQPFATLTPTRLIPTDTPTATLPPTSTSTATPSPTPTLPPLAFWMDPNLPADLSKEIELPQGTVWSNSAKDADVFIQVVEAADKSVLAETWWVYALAAPFFTLTDQATRADLKAVLTGSISEGVGISTSDLLIREADFNAVYAALGLKSSGQEAGSLAVMVENDFFNYIPDPTDPAWAVVPFERLLPQWKVIAVEGVSPLDEGFSPSDYNLALRVGLVPNPDSAHDLSSSTETWADVLPLSNRDDSRLTSLIMTGVTAMARDTAYIMSTEGVLFPGTEIRELMRSADLTHISNEVSFYGDCPFPNPEYEGFIFCSDPEYIDLLIDVGADIIELTGNHNNDVRALYKVDSVPFTLELYQEHAMHWYAGGVNQEDARAPLLLEHQGNQLAFIGCNSYGPDMAWATEDSSGAAACEDFNWLVEEVQSLVALGYLPIVTFQYQEDYYLEASTQAKTDFRRMAEAGAVIVNGSQSHVGKVIEFFDGGFIHYGLGNLFFDQPGYYVTYDSFIQKHFFYAGRHLSTQLITLTLEEMAKPRLMTQSERENFLTWIFEASEALRRTK